MAPSSLLRLLLSLLLAASTLACLPGWVGGLGNVGVRLTQNSATDCSTVLGGLGCSVGFTVCLLKLLLSVFLTILI